MRNTISQLQRVYFPVIREKCLKIQYSCIKSLSLDFSLLYKFY